MVYPMNAIFQLPEMMVEISAPIALTLYLAVCVIEVLLWFNR